MDVVAVAVHDVTVSDLGYLDHRHRALMLELDGLKEGGNTGGREYGSTGVREGGQGRAREGKGGQGSNF